MGRRTTPAYFETVPAFAQSSGVPSSFTEENHYSIPLAFSFILLLSQNTGTKMPTMFVVILSKAQIVKLGV